MQAPLALDTGLLYTFYKYRLLALFKMYYGKCGHGFCVCLEDLKNAKLQVINLTNGLASGTL